MCRDECPLQQIADTRLQDARSEVNAAKSEAELRACLADAAIGMADEYAWRDPHIMTEARAALFNAVKGNLRVIKEELVVGSEESMNAIEEVRCKGPVVRRGFGGLGKVLSVTCGSESRISRLQSPLILDRYDSHEEPKGV